MKAVTLGFCDILTSKASINLVSKYFVTLKFLLSTNHVGQLSSIHYVEMETQHIVLFVSGFVK